MLKIKDEVELSELEKFGFVKGKGEYPFYEFCKNDWWIIIRSSFKDVDILHDELCSGYIDEEVLKVLFNLFQAGLVEKVEDNE